MSESTGTTGKTPDDFNFLDPEVQDCPYDAYQVLRDQAPVYQDPHTGQYVITRFEDLREVLLDTENFGNMGRRDSDAETPPALSERQQRMLQVYQEKNGWLPEPTLAARDDPNQQMRNMLTRRSGRGRSSSSTRSSRASPTASSMRSWTTATATGCTSSQCRCRSS